MPTRRTVGGVHSWLTSANGSNGVNNSDDSLPPSGQTLQKAFEALVRTLNERRVRYAIIGGMATLQHTRVRTTDDIDALLSIPAIALPALLESLRDRGFSIDQAKCIREFRDDGLTAIRFRDVVVDLLRPMLPAYAHVLDRAIDAEILGQSVKICSAESLIVMKLIAMRPQDQSDIAELLSAYRGRLNVDYVRQELESMFPADDPRFALLEDLERRSNRSEP